MKGVLARFDSPKTRWCCRVAPIALNGAVPVQQSIAVAVLTSTSMDLYEVPSPDTDKSTLPTPPVFLRSIALPLVTEVHKKRLHHGRADGTAEGALLLSLRMANGGSDFVFKVLPGEDTHEEAVVDRFVALVREQKRTVKLVDHDAVRAPTRTATPVESDRGHTHYGSSTPLVDPLASTTAFNYTVGSEVAEGFVSPPPGDGARSASAPTPASSPTLVAAEDALNNTANSAAAATTPSRGANTPTVATDKALGASTASSHGPPQQPETYVVAESAALPPADTPRLYTVTCRLDGDIGPIIRFGLTDTASASLAMAFALCGGSCVAVKKTLLQRPDREGSGGATAGWQVSGTTVLVSDLLTGSTASHHHTVECLWKTMRELAQRFPMECAVTVRRRADSEESVTVRSGRMFWATAAVPTSPHGLWERLRDVALLVPQPLRDAHHDTVAAPIASDAVEDYWKYFGDEFQMCTGWHSITG